MARFICIVFYLLLIFLNSLLVSTLLIGLHFTLLYHCISNLSVRFALNQTNTCAYRLLLKHSSQTYSLLWYQSFPARKSNSVFSILICKPSRLHSFLLVWKLFAGTDDYEEWEVSRLRKNNYKYNEIMLRIIICTWPKIIRFGGLGWVYNSLSVINLNN